MLLTLFIFATAAPSGGHLNPTITFATLCTGHTKAFRALLYVIAQVRAATGTAPVPRRLTRRAGGVQCVGAVVGSLLAKEVLPDATVDAIHLGACALGDNMTTTGGLISEMFFTLILLFVAYGCAFDERQGAIFGPVRWPAPKRRYNRCGA